MKKIDIKKILAIFLLFLFFVSSNSNIIYGAINSNYETDETLDYEDDTTANSMLTVFSKILLPIIFPSFTVLEGIVAKAMDMITGEYFFPWADMVIYNSVPLLDVNFINPSPGSLFKDSTGAETVIGTTIRNMYFTVISICLGFLGVAIAINAIKLILSSLANEKARYKEAINSTLLTIILIFGMHYLISFVFYINEQLVIVASNITAQVISPDDILDASNNINETNYEDSKKLVENFVGYANHTSPSPITIAKVAIKGIVNGVQEICGRIGNAIKNTWDKIKEFFGWGDDDSEEELDGDDVRKLYEDIFPSKADVIDYLSDGSNCNKGGEHRKYHVGKTGVNVAAYLLKDKTFREKELSWVAGNDTNKFAENGVVGWLTSARNTVLWGTGIVDTGLLGLENLYEATFYICNNMKNDNNGQGFITSAKHYEKLNSEMMSVINDNTANEKDRDAARISLVYLNAYYKYVYDGEDKKDTNVKSIISNLGNYFKTHAYYTDLEGGDWAPKTFDVIPALLYCIFLIQSVMFLWSYIKRMFYVIILALLGPVVVIYDYIMKSY